MKEEMRESPHGRSMLSLYKTCPRRWAFKYLKGFKSKDSTDALNLGSAIHETQALYYLGMDLDACLIELRAFLGENTHLFPKALEMFKAWEKELGQYDRKNCTVLAVEEEAELKLPNGYKMSVRWDRVLLDNKTKEVFISDTKTTGGSASRTLQLYSYSDQPKLYIAAVLQNKPFWLKQFTGWRTDVIYGRELKSGRVNTEVIRSAIVSYSETDIEDTLLSYADLTSEIASALLDIEAGNATIQERFRSQNENCFNYNRLCPYHSFCSEIDSMEEPPANFELDPWISSKIVLDSFKEII